MTDHPQAGYEVRDISVPLVVLSAALLVMLGVALLAVLWGVSQRVAPEQTVSGASPPVVMPGEPPVDDRIRAIRPPRLDPLRAGSPTQHPEELRADRQPSLNGYGWVEPGKVARIPIGRAMDAVVAIEKAKKGGGK